VRAADHSRDFQNVRLARTTLRVATWLGYAAILHFAAHAIGAALTVHVLASPALELGSAVDAERPERDVLASSRAVVADPREASRERAVATLLGRSPFCPECMDAPPPPPPVDALEHFAPYGEGGSLDRLLHPGEPATTLPLRLVATMEAEAPGRSIATIRHDTRGIGVFARGDEIVPDVEVVRVGHGIVHLRNHETVEYLALRPPQAKAPAKKKTAKKKTAKKKTAKKNRYAIEGADEAIQCTRRLDCRIDRAFVEKLIAQPALLTRQGRMLPYKKGGTMHGYRLLGARRGTVPYLLGMRSGDVLTAVNGQPLGGPDGALGLYAKLRHASHLDLAILRKGKQLTMSLDIV
jgi:general secretion pathway protein C